MAEHCGRCGAPIMHGECNGPSFAEVRNALLETNRALGGALIILRAVRDREPVGSRPERVVQECARVQERYFAARDMLERPELAGAASIIDSAVGHDRKRSPASEKSDRG